MKNLGKKRLSWNKMTKNPHLFLILILIVASFLRLWQLNINPPGVHPDEADTAYSAYSILLTGKTQYGSFNPLAFEEFNGGTHPPLYTYFLIPFIKVFGLSITIERIPSAFFGSLLILIFFFFLKKIFNSQKIALVGSLLLAINPWAIHVSRQGLLESIALFFVVLGVLFFLYARDKRIFYYFSAIFLGLSLHAYDAPKIFIPLFLIILFYYEKDALKRSKKYFLSFLLIFIFFFFLMIKTVFFDGQINDYEKVSLLNSLSIVNTVNSERQFTKSPLLISSLFHNKATVLLKRFQTNYFNIFSINWLFVNGDSNLQQSVVRHGQFNFFELPFFFIGLFYLFYKKRKLAFFLLSWLMLAAIPGALTTGNYPYRSILIVPIPIIFSAFGLVVAFDYFSSLDRSVSRLLKLVAIFSIIAYSSSFLFSYFFDYPVYASEAWFKQRNEALNYASLIQNKYNKVYIVGDVEWAVMHAFNSKISPQIFQKAYFNRDAEGVMYIGRFSFGGFNPNKIATPSAYFPHNSLVVTDAADFPNEKPLKVFTGLDPLRKVYKVIEIN